jgi:hypothetical protein
LKKALSRPIPRDGIVAYSACRRINIAILHVALVAAAFAVAAFGAMNFWPSKEWEMVWRIALPITSITLLIEVVRLLILLGRRDDGHYGKMPKELGWIMEDMFNKAGLSTNTPLGRGMVEATVAIAIEEFKVQIAKLK